MQAIASGSDWSETSSNSASDEPQSTTCWEASMQSPTDAPAEPPPSSSPPHAAIANIAPTTHVRVCSLRIGVMRVPPGGRSSAGIVPAADDGNLALETEDAD